MKRAREETTTTTTTVGSIPKRRKYTTKSSARGMDIEASSRPGYYTVARTRGPYSKGEMKYYDSILSASGISVPASTNWTGTEFDPAASIGTTPVATPLTLCVPKQGPAINERVGREITVHKIKVRGVVSAAPIINADVAATLAENSCRVILVQDCQTNSTQCQGEDVMEAISNAAGWLSYQNIDNFGRFKVLKDKLFQCENHSIQWQDATHMTISGWRKNFKWNINFKIPVRIRFNATNGGTVADIIDNSFHIIANSNSINPQNRLQYKCRVCYKDV